MHVHRNEKKKRALLCVLIMYTSMHVHRNEIRALLCVLIMYTIMHVHVHRYTLVMSECERRHYPISWKIFISGLEKTYTDKLLEFR